MILYLGSLDLSRINEVNEPKHLNFKIFSHRKYLASHRRLTYATKILLANPQNGEEDGVPTNNQRYRI